MENTPEPNDLPDPATSDASAPEATASGMGLVTGMYLAGELQPIDTVSAPGAAGAERPADGQ